MKKILLVLLVTITSLITSSCSSIIYKTGIGKCAPVYGNWCGENYPSEGSNPRPVDAWDRACRSHDRCYDSGKGKEVCDNKLVKKLERLSRTRLSPIRMHNAHSWFLEDGFLGGYFNFKDEAWGTFASCEGGDGIKAEFYCAVNAFNGCRLRASDGPGWAGQPCNCRGYPGVIVEN